MYLIKISRPPLTAGNARATVSSAYARLGMDTGNEQAIDAHAEMLAKNGELILEHAGVEAHITLDAC